MRLGSWAFVRVWLAKRAPLVMGGVTVAVAFGLGIAAVWNPAWSLVAAAAIGAAAIVLSNPRVGVIGLVVLLTLNDLTVQLLGLGSEAAILFGGAKDALLAMLVIAAVVRLRTSAARLPVGLVYPVLIVLGLAVTSVLSTPTLSQALYGLRNDFQPLLILLLVPTLLVLQDTRQITLAFVVCGEAAALIAIGTHSLGVEWLLRLGYASAALPSAYFLSGSGALRAFSPYIDPNTLGLASLFVLCVILCRTDWRKRYRYALLVLPSAALILSLSRSAFIGAIIAGSMIAARWWRHDGANRTRILAGTAAAAVVGVMTSILLWGGQGLLDASARGHLDSLVTFGDLALHYPLGFGVGALGSRAGRFAEFPVFPESFLLLIALDAGILALVAYLFVLGRAARRNLNGSRAAGLDGEMAFLGVVVLAASLPSQLTLLVMEDAAVSWSLWILVGLALIHSRSVRVGASDREAAASNMSRS